MSAARFFRGGFQVVSGSQDRTFKLWDLKAGKCITFINFFKGECCNQRQGLLFFHASFLRLLVILGTKTFFIGSLVLDVAANDHYRMVATGHHDQKIRFWDARDVDPVKIVDLFGKVNGLTYAPGTSMTNSPWFWLS